jgi:hypothetical protein
MRNRLYISVMVLLIPICIMADTGKALVAKDEVPTRADITNNPGMQTLTIIGSGSPGTGTGNITGHI